MSNFILERLFSILQTLIFKQIGNKIPTNALKNLMDYLFVIFEKVGCKFAVVSEIYLKLYDDVVTKEITMAHITNNDKVLVIGSGSLPATPALIAQKTQTAVVSIDKDHTAIKHATNYVKTHHLENRLTIQYGDGLTYPVEQFNIIFVLYGVKKPQLILEYLADHITENTRLIFRTITDMQGNITDKTIDLLKRFDVKGQIHTETLGSFTSFLIIKK